MIIFIRLSTSFGLPMPSIAEGMEFSGNKLHAGSDSSAARVGLAGGHMDHQMEVFYTHAVQHQRLETFLTPVAHKKY